MANESVSNQTTDGSEAESQLNRQAKKRLSAQKCAHRNRSFVYAYLDDQKCMDCGEEDSLVLDFDHIDDNKSFDISKGIKDRLSLKRIFEEIEKCEVICSNCHRKRTATQYNWGIVDILKDWEEE